MPVVTLTINEKMVSAQDDQTLLDVLRENDIKLPTLCHMDGLSERGGCRLCLVEISGSAKLLPACTTLVQEGLAVTTHSERLIEYRKMNLELLFAERNHVCAVCVMNGHCELQKLAASEGMTHVRFDYISPDLEMDASHDRYVIDHNRCVLCTRCVRV
ncbi:MAG: 2Fe-2S iron-sulfur cluster binding domain-containing protein, partial [Candidatus Latescibacteria bacterium]|nr:2Fe-2S iron-sulfur cluster binding domain-containing protein [Candidatus Latescibacterota bacterium]